MLEIFILSILILIQSVFGVGLLIIGTPVFLLIFNDFFYSLSLLLPLSVTISLIQIVSSQKRLKIDFLKNFNFFCIPGVILTLVIISFLNNVINLKIFISLIIIIFSTISIINVKKLFIYLSKFSTHKLTFLLLGSIHGLTNVGGTLLTLLCSFTFKKKETIRLHIAYGYFSMGAIQLFLLFFFKKFYFDNNILILLLFTPFIFLLSKIIFNKINTILFIKYINILALFSGIYLFFNSLK